MDMELVSASERSSEYHCLVENNTHAKTGVPLLTSIDVPIFPAYPFPVVHGPPVTAGNQELG